MNNMASLIATFKHCALVYDCLSYLISDETLDDRFLEFLGFEDRQKYKWTYNAIENFLTYMYTVHCNLSPALVLPTHSTDSSYHLSPIISNVF